MTLDRKNQKLTTPFPSNFISSNLSSLSSSNENRTTRPSTTTSTLSSSTCSAKRTRRVTTSLGISQRRSTRRCDLSFLLFLLPRGREAREKKKKKGKSSLLLPPSRCFFPTPKNQKTGGLQPRLHPHLAPLPAEGLRPLPHRLQLRALEEGRQSRHARKAALGPRSGVIPLVLDPRRPRRLARSQRQPVDQGHLGPDRGEERRRDQDAGEPRVSFRF